MIAPRKYSLLAALCLSAFAQLPTWDTPQVVIPSQEESLLPIGGNGQLIFHQAYSLSYDEAHEQASWVYYEFPRSHASGEFKRSNDYREDPSVHTASARLSDYKNSGYDRGHLVPAADMQWSITAMSETFFLSNMSPQIGSFNGGVWKRLEGQVRKWASETEKLYVVTGPILNPALSTIGESGVSVPAQFYKIVLDLSVGQEKGIGFIMSNTKSVEHIKTFVVSIDTVEKATGLDFFPGLEDQLEGGVEHCSHWEDWEETATTPSNANIGVPKTSTVVAPSTSKNSDGDEPSSDGAGRLSVAVQCSGTTQKGARCKRNTKNANGRCYQH